MKYYSLILGLLHELKTFVFIQPVGRKRRDSGGQTTTSESEMDSEPESGLVINLIFTYTTI